MTTVEHYIKLLESITAGTMKILEGIPEEHFDWRPWEGTFSFKEAIGHIISDELEFIRGVTKALGLPSLEVPSEPKENLKEELGRFWEIHRQMVSLVNSLKDQDLEKVAKFPTWNWEAPIYEAIGPILEHQVHHRGQLIVYFRILGLEPPKRWED